jgi:NAD(P)H-nitrite reductase large subunit
MADSATVCGCVGVTKGAIIRAIHEQGVNTLSQLKRATAREHGLRQLHALCQDCSRRSRPSSKRDAEGAVRVRAVPQDNLREILRSQRLQSVQECSTSTATARLRESASRR